MEDKFREYVIFLLKREDHKKTLMNYNSKNSENKNVKSNRFLRADEHTQYIKTFFGLNVNGSSKIQFLNNIIKI